MSAGTEADDLMDFILATLEADATLSGYGLNGWYKDGAQTTEGYPFGIVGMLSSLPVTYPGPIHIGANALIQVKVVGRAGVYDSIIKPAYKRVYALLFGLDGTTSDITVLGKLIQETEINYADPQLVDGEQIRHLGGGWRSLVK